MIYYLEVSANAIINGFTAGIAGVLIGLREQSIPETVGQYTGLTDKNNKPIFEGDKVRVPMHKVGETPNYMTGFVEWINGAFSVTWDDTQYGRHFAGYLENIEIIGNVYDTPKVVRVRRIK